MKRHVEFQRLHSFRDLGGYRASDSRTVPWQALYRSDSLGKLQGADWERFLGLGICTVIDLRYPWEIEAKRSEEHTSELQSRENLVCRLLLEKKKIIKTMQ